LPSLVTGTVVGNGKFEFENFHEESVTKTQAISKPEFPASDKLPIGKISGLDDLQADFRFPI
jgi:hypothetical protein